MFINFLYSQLFYPQNKRQISYRGLQVYKFYITLFTQIPHEIIILVNNGLVAVA